MRRYEIRETTVREQALVEASCDGCGWSTRYPSQLISVVIEVHEGEEGGSRDEYEYCDDCLVARAAALVAAGSRAELVTFEETPDDDRV